MSRGKEKTAKLGMSFGTAYYRLLRMLLFKALKDSNKNICYRCGRKIKLVKDLSIEHKKSWEFGNNPKKDFFDLKSIAFSHLSCNVRAPKFVKKPVSGYRGVSFSPDSKRNKPWRAVIKPSGSKKRAVRYFKTPREAAQFYDLTVEKIYGLQAITNKSFGLL